MAQKLFAPFRKIPSQVQSLPGINKIFDGKRVKLQKELFGFTECADFGLPANPSAIAHDTELNLLAIGFESGLLKVVGAPGVSFNGTHPDGAAVRRLVFVPNEGRVVSLTGDNKIFLWELNENEQGSGILELKKDLAMPNEADGDAVTAICLSGDHLYIGCANSQVRKVDLKEWKLLEDDDLSVEKLTEVCSDRFKEQLTSLNGRWGAVTSIECGGSARGLLIGYSQGLALVYREGHVTRLILRSTEPRLELESATWCPGSAESFMTSFESGTYSLWTEDISQTMPSTNPYGPMPCWSISKIARFVISDGSELIAFVGGLPRAEYAERESVTLQQAGEPEILLSLKLSSPVVDILPLRSGPDEPVHSLIVLCRDEVVGLDFRRKGYPTYELPYLRNFRVNQSDVTAVALPEEPINGEVLEKLESFSEADTEWPVAGGRLLTKEGETSDSIPPVVFATGHADGSVAIWHVDGLTAAVRRLVQFETSRMYTDGAASDAEKTSDWPPMRAVGEQRRGPAPAAASEPAEGETEGEAKPPATPMAIRHLVFAKDGAIVVGGDSGQASIWTPSNDARTVECDVIKVVADIIPDDQKANWKWQGGNSLGVQEGEINFPAGFAPTTVAQVEPAGQVRSLAYSVDWSMLGVGSNHGYVLIDTSTGKIVTAKSTLPEPVAPVAGEEGAAAAAEGEGGRVANIRKSLRNSFRRLKKLRPGHSSSYNVEQQAAGDDKKEEKKEGEAEEKKEGDEEGEKKEEEKPAEEGGDAAAATAPVATSEEAEGAAPAAKEEEATAPTATEEEAEKDESEKKEEEAEPPPPPEPKDLTDDSAQQSSVRCLSFVRTSAASAAEACNCVVVGTNAGHVFLSRLDKNEEGAAGEEGEAATPEGWSVQVLKRITMKHAAPVVSALVLDSKAHQTPVGCLTEVCCQKAPEEPMITEETKSEGDVDADKPKEEEAAAKEEAAPAEEEKKEEEKKEEKEEKAEEKKEEEKKEEEAKEKEAKDAKSKSATLPSSSGSRASALLQKTLTLGRGRSSSNVPELHHELLICTEEQAKLYALPSLRVKSKARLAEGDGRVITSTTQLFRHQDSSSTYSEYDLVAALTNGQVTVLSLPTLRKQFVQRQACGDAKGAALGCCTSVGFFIRGNGATLGSFNLGIRAPISLHTRATVDLPEGARPVKEEPVAEETKEEEAKAEGEEAKEAEAAPAEAAAESKEAEAEAAPAADTAADDAAAAEEKEEVGELTEKLGDVSLGSNKVADITQDSIKEYVEGTCGGDESEKTTVVVHEEHQTTTKSVKDGDIMTTTTSSTTEKEINEDGEKVTSTTTVTTSRASQEAGEAN